MTDSQSNRKLLLAITISTGLFYGGLLSNRKVFGSWASGKLLTDFNSRANNSFRQYDQS